MEFQLNINALNFLNFNSIFKVQSFKTKLFCHCVSMLPFIIIHFLVLVNLICNEEISFRTNISAIYHLFNGVLTILRRAFYIYRKKDFEDLVMLFQTVPYEQTSFRRMETAMRARSTRRIRRTNLQLFTPALVVVLGMLLLVASRILEQAEGGDGKLGSLVFQMWFPWDPRAAPAFAFVITWQCCVELTYILVTNSSDAFLCALMMAAGERADLLARAAPRALLPGHGGRITPRFRAWVNYHQHYVQLVQRVNSLLGPMVVVTNFSGLFSITLLSFLSTKLSSGLGSAMALVASAVTLVKVLVMCRAGQHLVDKSELLRRSVVGVAQVTTGGLPRLPHRSALQVLVTRLSAGARPEGVSGMGYFTVSMQLFTSVLSASVTYFLFLLDIKKRNVGGQA